MTDRNARLIAVLTAVGVAVIIAQMTTLLARITWSAVSVVAVLVYVFWDKVAPRTPKLVRQLGRAIRGFLTHPVIFFGCALGLLTAAYVTQYRYLLIALGAVIVVLEVPRLRWRELVSRQPSARSVRESPEHSGSRRLPKYEILQGRPGPGTTEEVLEFLHHRTARNLFVLIEGGDRRDFTVDFEVLLAPGALLNLVGRYNRDVDGGYMLRVDTRTEYAEGDCVLILQDGGWGQPLVSSHHYVTPDQWTRVRAMATGTRLEILQDAQSVCSVDDGQFQAGRIGFFNEVGDAAIRNVVVS